MNGREPDPFIVSPPDRSVSAAWTGPTPWVLTGRRQVSEWRDGTWQPRDLAPGELVGAALLRGTICVGRQRCDMTFVPGEAGGMVICDDCGHAAEVLVVDDGEQDDDDEQEDGEQDDDR